MRKKIFTTMVIVGLLLISFGPQAALADAYESAFTTSITYQNLGVTDTQSLSIIFYASPDDTTGISINLNPLKKGASSSVFVGGLGLDPGFQGTAVMSSTEPLGSVAVQLPQNSPTVKVYPLSNGFSSGTPNSLIATVVKNTFNANTIFSVQNASTVDVNVTIKFIDSATATAVCTLNRTIKGGAGYVVDAGREACLPSTFNGSVTITSGGSIVSSAMELDYGSGRTGAKAFEGVGQGSKTIYMPSAVCQNTGQNGAFAVQNTSLSQPTDVTVTYSNNATETKTIGAGAKASFLNCDRVPANFLGSATVVSTTTDVIAVGKISGNGASTAYVGFASGSQKAALPYVRWPTSNNFFNGYMPRTNIAIQNVSTSQTIPSGTIKVYYVDRDGVIVGTHTINQDLLPGQKVNSNASNAGLVEFGCYSNCTQFGGGALVEGPVGSSLAVIARNTTYVSAYGWYASEDYNGIPSTLVLP